MRVLSTYESRADVTRRPGLAQLRIIGADEPGCASPGCAELRGHGGVPLVPIGVWR